MANPRLRKAVEDRWKDIIESLLYQSQGEDDYLLDVEYLSKIKTFKQVCECNGQDYREVIQELKQEVANV